MRDLVRFFLFITVASFSLHRSYRTSHFTLTLTVVGPLLITLSSSPPLLITATTTATAAATDSTFPFLTLSLPLIAPAGSRTERLNALEVLPLIQNHHLLLVSLLLWNATASEGNLNPNPTRSPPTAYFYISEPFLLFSITSISRRLGAWLVGNRLICNVSLICR